VDARLGELLASLLVAFGFALAAQAKGHGSRACGERVARPCQWPGA
jgi:hypothetical protein